MINLSKHMILLLLACNLCNGKISNDSKSCMVIGDFAPTNVGSTWVYNVDECAEEYENLLGGTLTGRISSIFLRSYCLQEIIPGTDTTLLIFGVFDSGVKIAESLSQETIPNSMIIDTTAIAVTFTDTGRIIGDRIYHTILYYSHDINSDSLSEYESLSTLVLAADTLCLYERTPGGCYYLQNVGLYMKKGGASGIRGARFYTLTLASYESDNKMLVHTRLSANQPSFVPQIEGSYFKQLFDNFPIVNAQGRKVNVNCGAQQNLFKGNIRLLNLKHKSHIQAQAK